MSTPVNRSGSPTITTPLLNRQTGEPNNSTVGQPKATSPTGSNRASSPLSGRQSASSAIGSSSAQNRAPRAPLTFVHEKVYPDGSVGRAKLVAKAAKPDEQGRTGAMYGIPKWVTTGMREGAETHTDSHFHPSDYVQRTMRMDVILKLAKRLGIRHTTLMPIPTSLCKLPQGGIVVRRQMVEAAVENFSKGKQRADSHDHDHFCGTMDSYYVPPRIAEKIKQDTGRDLDIQHFVDDPTLLTQIVEANEVYPDTAVNEHLAADINAALARGEISEADRDCLDPMATGFNLGDPRAGHKLLVLLYRFPGIFTGIGEITIKKELIQLLFSALASQASTDSPELMDAVIDLLQVAGIIGMPGVLHCDIDDLMKQIEELRTGGEVGKDPLHFDGLKKLFTDPRVADTKLVWAHGGGLGRFVQQGPNHLELVGGLLDECSNLHLDISWSEVAKQINKDEGTQEKWIDFLEKYSTRICFGSDALAPSKKLVDGEDLEGENRWNQTKAMHDPILAKLSEGARNNILNDTYERLFVDSRKAVREFEQKVLTPEWAKQNLLDTDVESPISAAALQARKDEVMPKKEMVTLQAGSSIDPAPQPTWGGPNDVTAIEGRPDGTTSEVRGLGDYPGQERGRLGRLNGPGTQRSRTTPDGPTGS